MTNEQAVKWLKAYIQETPFQMEQYERAFQMAIKALSQEPCPYSTKDGHCQYDDIAETIPTEQEPCDDVVSRILTRMWNCRGKHTTSIDKVKMEQIIRDELPSVTFKSIGCDDVVSREAVLKLKHHKPEYGDMIYAFDVEQLPSVTQKSGKWILLDECANSGYYCSRCQKKLVKEGWSDTVKKIKFCPNCGCRMVEPQESEEV